MALLSEIRSSDWQPELGADAAVVEGLDDIGQCIRIILETPIGSDPHRPEFGSNLHLYLDWPQNRVVPHLVREAYAAISRWEPRIGLLSVDVSFTEAAITLDIEWSGAGGVVATTAVTLAQAQ
jgi:phage baseplate assembly protein W